jgi:antitoxin MazE
MRTSVQKWGNSLAVRIPKAIAAEAGVAEKDDLEMQVVGDAIQIRRCRPQPSLEDLLAGVTPENLHGEADFGTAQGREAW